MNASSRRDFLKTSAIAATGLAVGSSILRADDQSAEKGPAIRWGVIGTGHRMRAHISAMKTLANTKIAGACDVMESHLALGVKEIGDAVETYSDYQKLLANPDINAVVIATPNLLHKEMVIAALQAGKHVMCEKPISTNLEDAHAMKLAADQRPAQVVLYCMQLRYSTEYQQVRKHIEAGRIGKPRHLLVVEHRGDWYAGDVWKYTDPGTGKSVNWRYSHTASGGTLNEKLCHYYDLMHWFAGSTPQNLSCTGGIAVYNDGRETWDHAVTTVTYPGGAIGTVDLCMFGPHRLEMQILGDEASIKVSEGSIILQSRKGGLPENLPLPEEVHHGERGPSKGIETAVVKMYADFIDCISNNKKPWMDVDKATVSSKTAFLGELSVNQKKEVSWDALV